jgi:putative intracellular protease/amidase
MKKVLILVENGYEEMELWVPYCGSLDAELDVVLVGPEAGCTCTGKHDLAARASVSFAHSKLGGVRAVLSAAT